MQGTPAGKQAGQGPATGKEIQDRGREMNDRADRIKAWPSGIRSAHDNRDFRAGVNSFEGK